MTDFHLIRHGETIWHAQNQYAGISDVPLTDRGYEQAEQLATWVGQHPPTLIVSSDLQRARITAAAAAARSGVSHVVDDRWREVGFGRGEGMTRDQMRSAFPAELEAFLRAPGSTPLPEGESGAAAVARSLPALAELAASPGTVVVVAHTTLIRLLLCTLLGLPIDSYRSVFPALSNTAINTVRVPTAPPNPDALRGAGALLALNVPAGG